jgi:cytochrome P450
MTTTHTQLQHLIADRGAMDAVTDFAQPLTIRIICEQLGLDWSIKDRIARWSVAVTAQIGRMQDREEMLEHAAQICDLQHYIIGKMRERQAEPREDMISDLVHAEVTNADGTKEKLTFEEAVSLVRATLIAGNDTMALGAVAAVDAAGLTGKVIVAGMKRPRAAC